MIEHPLDHSTHQDMLDKSHNLTGKSLHALNRLKDALLKLRTHDDNPDAHPDIEKAIREFKGVGIDEPYLSENLIKHDLDPEAHPNLQSDAITNAYAGYVTALQKLKEHNTGEFELAHHDIRNFLNSSDSNTRLQFNTNLSTHLNHPTPHKNLQTAITHIANCKFELTEPLYGGGTLTNSITVSVRTATTSVLGVARTATDSEAIAGEVDAYVTSKHVGDFIKDFSDYSPGMIIWWYGDAAAVPEGWRLCNGTNGAPDLRNRMLVGAGSTYALGAIGGSTTATLTVTVGYTSLAEYQIPTHQHIPPLAGDMTKHSGREPWGNWGRYIAGSGSSGAVGPWPYTSPVGGNQGHNHPGYSSTINRMPPYLALHYIQKI